MRRGMPGMRRGPAVLAVLLLIAPGCGGPPSPGAGSSPSPSHGTDVSGLLGADPTTAAAAAVLVAGPEGVFLFAPDRGALKLVDGPAAVAVDDLRGGLIYQRARGRPDRHAASAPTAIEWVREGGGRPVTLVAPGPGVSLALHDAVEVAGEVAVFSTRFEGGVGHDDTVDTLVRTAAATRASTDVRRVGGFEETSEPISVTASMLVLTYLDNITGAFEFLAPDGTPVTPVHNPRPAGTNCDAPCADLAELSPDAATLAYVEKGPDPAGFMVIPEVVLMDMGSGEELRRLRLDRPDQGWWPASLDLGEGVLVVNRTAPAGPDTGEPAEPWVIDLRGEEPVVWQAPLAGHARLVRSEPSVRTR